MKNFFYTKSILNDKKKPFSYSHINNSLIMDKKIIKLLKKWEKYQAKNIFKVSGLGYLAISLTACNGSKNYSSTDLEEAKINALTDSNGIVYSDIDTAIISNDAAIANATLTDTKGNTYASVDAAITSNDTVAANAIVLSNTGLNSLTELISSYIALTDPSTAKLSLATTDSPNLTLNNDNIDASTRNSLQTGDTITDNSTSDLDVLTANITVNNIAPTVTNIETININGDFLVTGISLTKVLGTDNLNLSTSLPGGAGTVTNASNSAIGKINASTNIATLNVSSSSSGTGSSGLIINGGQASTLNINAGSGADIFNVNIADKSVLNLGPVTNFASPDLVNVFFDGETTINSTAAMGNLNIISDTNSKVLVTGALGTRTDFTGSGNIELSTTGAIADAATSVSSSGLGTLTLNLTNVNNNDVSTVSADLINHMHPNGTGLTISGSSVLNLDVALATSSINLNSPGTMILNVSETQTSKITTGSNVIALTLSSTPDEIKDTINNDIITLKDLQLNSNTTNVAILGPDSLTISKLSTNANTTLSASSMTGDLIIGEMASYNTTLYLGSGKNNVTSGNVTASFTIIGSNGDDTVNLDGSSVLSSNISTHGGNDTVIGGAKADIISTGNGNDIVNGSAGFDIISLGSGNDVVIIKSKEDGDVITDFTLDVDTLVLTGNSGGNINLMNQSEVSGTYNIDGSGNFDVTLTGSNATDLRGSVQLGTKLTSKVAPGEVLANITFNPFITGMWNVNGGNKNDILLSSANSGKTISTGLGNDIIIVTSAASGNIVISDFDILNDKIILTGSAGAKDVIDLTNTTISSNKYLISTNHNMSILKNGSTFSSQDIRNSIQLGNSETSFSLNDSTGSTSVKGGSHNDYIELADGGNQDTVFFIDNGGFDTITSFTKSEDKLNFDSITGISANGISFFAGDSKVTDAINGEVYVFASENLTGVDAKFDFNGENNDATLDSLEVMSSAASYLEAAITEANGEKYVALINTAKGVTDRFVAYLIDGDTDGINVNDLTLIGSIDADNFLVAADIS